MNAPQGEQTAPQAGPTVTSQNQNMLMGILAYLGILVVVPFMVAKDDPFVKFHIKQGLILLVIEVAVWFLTMVIWLLAPIAMLVNLGVLVLSIMGIVNVVQGHEKELPVVGKFSSYFKF